MYAGELIDNSLPATNYLKRLNLPDIFNPVIQQKAVYYILIGLIFWNQK